MHGAEGQLGWEQRKTGEGKEKETFSMTLSPGVVISAPKAVDINGVPGTVLQRLVFISLVWGSSGSI